MRGKHGHGEEGETKGGAGAMGCTSFFPFLPPPRLARNEPTLANEEGIALARGGGQARRSDGGVSQLLRLRRA